MITPSSETVAMFASLLANVIAPVLEEEVPMVDVPPTLIFTEVAEVTTRSDAVPAPVMVNSLNDAIFSASPPSLLLKM